MPKENDPLQTPMMKQYLEIKNQFPDAILFFRMGDFYEMFLEDAKEAASILDIALTKRNNDVPMCGVPYHSREPYIARLLASGKKIAICEQSDSYENGNTKLLTREVVRIITPGTVVEENLLSGFENNFLAVLLFQTIEIQLALADVSTGDLFYFRFQSHELSRLKATLLKFHPREICIPENQIHFLESDPILREIHSTKLPKSALDGMTAEDFDGLHSLIQYYISQNYRSTDFFLKDPIVLEDSKYLAMDAETVANLELAENAKEEHHTLFHVMNQCVTAKGKRLLKNRLLFPSTNPDVIQKRWEKIAQVSQNDPNGLSAELKESQDLERILARMRSGKSYPRDFQAIRATIHTAKQLAASLEKSSLKLRIPRKEIDSLEAIISERITDKDLPAILGNGEFLRDGYSQELDKAREAKVKGKDWILQLETDERKRTGINTLKIRYNKIVGYFMEISKGQAEKAPSDYVKKQTLVGSERFSFHKLDEIETTILEADDTIQRIEKEEFEFLVLHTLQTSQPLLILSDELAELDFVLSLYKTKQKYNWTKPEMNDTGEIILHDARHPVVEAFLPVGQQFIPNTIRLDTNKNTIAILTGPNMAGKSTFMRQVALNCILFQIGSYIPAEAGSFCILDQLFTRIGAGDNLTAGESTFYLEMKETANILRNATKHSLILFDEVGRGTSTYDGLSLAWAIVEHLSAQSERTKTIFATHYHELTELSRLPSVFNLYMDTYEKDSEVVFLKKVRPGKAKKSFGIYVAKIAGVPESVVHRAEEILRDLESKKKEIKIFADQPSLFAAPEIGTNYKNLLRIEEKLNSIETDNLKPIEALSLVDQLKQILKK